MSWSYRKESALRQLPVPLDGSGWLSALLAYLANLPLLGTILAVLILLVLAGVIFAAIILYVLLGPVPIPKELPSATAASSRIYAGDGTLIATWHGTINREPVPLADISPNLQAAVVAEEDARFYSDPGVDLRSILRAAIADFESGKILEGGSTLTQQYVKDAYVGDRPTLSRKLFEARIALELTRRLTKAQIMDRYLNTAYFGDGAYGAEVAAETYFGEHASALTVSQAAMLAGIIHSPDNDSPIQHPAAAEADRLRVIQRMESLGSITPAQADQARADALSLVAQPAANPAFSWYLDALRTSLISRYGSGAVYGGGLEVHTTMDPAMQAAAEAAIGAALPSPSDPSAALVAVDPATGYVKAVVGGRDYASQKFNTATMGRRQPGSAFKPFVLAAALEQGISPDALFSGPSRLCLKGWTPGCVSNFGYESFGSISLLNATVNSVNTVYAQLMNRVGPENVVNIAHKMGIPAPADVVPTQVGCRPLGSPACRTYLPAIPSLALGSAGVTPLEMASAYATLAAGGVYRAPTFVSEVRSSSGAVLASGPSPGTQAIPGAIADEETQILQQVIVRGTGTAAAIGQPAAGKTGTAQNFDNAWFVGYTPTLATSVWVGDLTNDLPLLNVEGVPQVAGGTIPARIWSSYMQVALDTDPPSLAVGSGLASGSVTNQREPVFTGASADDTGNVMSVEASVDGGPFSTAGATCTRCPGRSVTWAYRPPAALADGSHTLAIRSVDVAGRDSPVQVRTITVDTVPPKATGLASQGGATALTATFSKPLLCTSVTPADFRAVVGGRFIPVLAVACPDTADAQVGLTLGAPPRGGDQVALTVQSRFSGGATDQAGNAVAGPLSVTTVAGNVAPAVAVTGGMAPGALTANARPTYQGTATDPDGNVARIEASVDGGPFASTGMACGSCTGGGAGALAAPVTWSWQSPSRLADGSHVVAFRSVDNATAGSALVTQTVTIDTVPPKLGALTATGAAPTLTLSFSKPMACSSLQPGNFFVSFGYRTSSVVTVGCAGSVNDTITLGLSTPPRGGDTVAVTVLSPYAGGPTDQAGNAVASPRMVRVIAANTAPALSVAGGAPGDVPTSNPHPSYQGTATDPDGNVAAIQASIDGAPFAGYGMACSSCGGAGAIGAPAPWTWQSPLRLADGTHTLAFRAVDTAGADSPPVTQTVTIDTVAPKLAGLTASGGSASLTATFSKPLLCSTVIPANLTVLVGSRSFPVDGVSCPGTASPAIGITLGQAPRGGDQVSVLAATAVTDQAGNPVAGPRVSATASNSAPAVGLSGGASGPAGQFTSDPRPSFTGTASDPDGAVVRVEASVDGGPFGGGGAVSCTGCLAGAPAGAPGGLVTWTYQAYRLGDGPHVLAFQAVDNAGATSAAVTQTVIVDARPPALKAVLASGQSSILSLVFSKPVSCSSVNVGEFTVTDAGSPLAIQLVSCVGAEDAVVDLALAQVPAMGDTVHVELSRGIIDAAGNRLGLPAAADAPATTAPSDLP